MKACIFDLDGTLTNTLESMTYSVNLTLEEMGLSKITKDQCRLFVGNGARVLIEKSLKAAGDTDASRIEEGMEIYGRIFDRNCTYHVTPYEGIPEMLKAQKDKVIQLVNDLDNNVFNGDIGFIERITGNKIIIDFVGNKVEYEKKDLKNIKHAYAISIHKSQGSEFMHVIMPISTSYYKMLYNKLIYTGVSRAKKSLTLVGDPTAFQRAVNNNYSSSRKTSLKEQISIVYNK